jgi:hypothetical protein
MIFKGENRRTHNLRLEPIPGMELDDPEGADVKEGVAVHG